MMWPPTDRPIIVIDPMVRFGRPQIRGISTQAIASMVMAGESVEDVARDYSISRTEVVLACWHEGETMFPQPYPLWCVEASREHGVFTGRVIGWTETGEGIDDELSSGGAVDYKPVIMTHQPDDGTLGAICGPVEYEQLFIGDDPSQLRQQAVAWMRSKGYDAIPAPGTVPESVLDAAMHSVWLHGDWRFLTSKMSGEEREAAAAAVERYHQVMDVAEGKPSAPVDPSGLRWWL